MTPNQKKLAIDIALLLGVLLIGFLIGHRSKPVDLTDYKKQIADKDTIIKLITKEREAINFNIEKSESENKLLKEKDSILTTQYQNNQSIYKLLNDKIKKIDDVVDAAQRSPDSLRANFSRFE